MMKTTQKPLMLVCACVMPWFIEACAAGGALGGGPAADDGPIGVDAGAGAEGSTPASDAMSTPDAAVRANPDANSGAPGVGHALLILPDNHWHRIEARPGGSDEDLGAELDSQSAGADQFANMAASNQWFVFQTTRFGCLSGGCIVRTSGDLSSAQQAHAEVVKADGQSISSEGRPAIDSSGTHIAFETGGGPHGWDLYLTTLGPSGWSAPALLSGSSTAMYQHDPFFSPDGSRIAFVCGPQPYKSPGSQICEVNLDGTGFTTAVSLANGPSGNSVNADNGLYEPSYEPDGRLVFEGIWSTLDTQQVWIAPSGGGTTSLVNPTHTNDVSPCVLPDGRILSLWLERPGNSLGHHELKVMNADGSNMQMIVTGIDIQDVGTGCGS